MICVKGKPWKESMTSGLRRLKRTLPQVLRSTPTQSPVCDKHAPPHNGWSFWNVSDTLSEHRDRRLVLEFELLFDYGFAHCPSHIHDFSKCNIGKHLLLHQTIRLSHPFFFFFFAWYSKILPSPPPPQLW